jgi:hypothetical protein
MFDEAFTARFWDRVDRSDWPSGCWIWNGRINDKSAGVVACGQRSLAAYRVAYQLVKGVIAQGKLLRHSCDIVIGN